MKLKFLIAMLIFFAAVAVSSYPQQPQKPLSKDQVMGLAKAGMETSELVKLIHDHGVDFDVADDFVRALRQAGAQEPVIQALRAARPQLLTKEQVLELLTAHVPNQRATELVTQRGINFLPDEPYFEMLRLAGADGALIAAVRTAGESLTAQLDLETSPNADVYLDGLLVGRANSAGLFTAKPKAGLHALKVTLPGKQDFTQNTTLAPGQDNKVTAALADLPTPAPTPARGVVRLSLGHLGMGIGNLNEDSAKTFKAMDGTGAVVLDVTPSGVAEIAGVKPSDVIRKLNDQEIKNAGELVGWVANLSPGVATLDILRDGQPMSIKVTMGLVRRGYLGLQIHNLDVNLAKQFKSPDTAGALVENVSAGGPADQAGMKPGDIVRSFNGQAVEDASQLTAAVVDLSPGAVANVELLRDGQPVTLTVTLRDRPAGLGNGTVGGVQRGVLRGVAVLELTSAVREHLGLPANSTGVVVARLDTNSPAAEAGLQEGDLIESIDRQPLHSIDDFNRLAAQAQKDTLIRITRQGTGIYLVISAKAASH